MFHQAAQAGVRLSWSGGFAEYVGHNVLATQRLLEAVVAARPAARVVYASSSSVYGNQPRYPTVETDLPKPFSPYGVTKMAAEHLCGLYSENWGVHTVSLRYFTVYGPRQRPDAAIHRLCQAAIDGSTFPLYGDGTQIREFTYVADIVAGNLAAADGDVEPGTYLNLAGGSEITLNELIALVGDVAGAPVDRSIRARRWRATRSATAARSTGRAKCSVGNRTCRCATASKPRSRGIEAGVSASRRRSSPCKTVIALPVSNVRSPASNTCIVPPRAEAWCVQARRAEPVAPVRREHAVHGTRDRVFVDTDLRREATRHDVVHAVVAGRGHVHAAHVGERAQRR